MLNVKLDRLNQLELTVEEVNNIKSQLMAELERIEKIESAAIAEISDLQSEILTSVKIMKPAVGSRSDIKISDQVWFTLDRWEDFQWYQEYIESAIYSFQNELFVLEGNKAIICSSLPGGTNSPLQKAIDYVSGYTKARYGKSQYFDFKYSGNLPELSVELTFSKRKDRNYWHGNHVRKQIWYDAIKNKEFWDSQLVNWSNTNPDYWLGFENLVKLSDEVKAIMTTCPNYYDVIEGKNNMAKFVTEKIAYHKKLQLLMVA